MNPEISKQTVTAPSKGAIAKGTGIALLIAVLLLFVAVLPAEKMQRIRPRQAK